MSVPSQPSDRRALVVDDEVHLRLMISRYLARNGWECLTASTSAEALESLSGPPVTHAVVDLHLGLESGLDLIRSMIQRAPAIRIVAMTGALAGSGQAAIMAGAAGFLTKPVQDLREIVDALLGAGVP